jgi:dTDP-4-dehydrorhamnose reductase
MHLCLFVCLFFCLFVFWLGKPVKVDDWATRWPTHVDDVARACRRLSERRLRHCMLSGTWHFAGPVKTTKYRMALDIAKRLEMSAELVTPDSDPPAGAARPKDCT